MFVEFDKANRDWLLCPGCKNFELHHEAVTVFERDELEDGPSGAVEVGDELRCRRIEGARAEAGNPSARRNGVAIRFWCEQCSDISELTIAQHKGTSLVQWRRVARRLG
jgi:hypothetical protein